MFSNQNKNNDGTYKQFPFPFLVYLEVQQKLHAVLVTGIQYDENKTKYFLIHDPGFVYTGTDPNCLAYQPVVYSDFVRALRLEVDIIPNELHDMENLSYGDFASFAVPLFYDNSTLMWYIASEQSGGNSARSLAASVGYSMPPLLPTVEVNSGLHAVSGTAPQLDNFFNKQNAKQVMPILQMLLGD
jgi:hypothetical protein